MTTGARASGWRDSVPPKRAWKGRAGRSRRALTAEQDRAAGGADRRWVDLGDGRRAHASVVLKLLPHTRRIRAYLRWSDKGRSPTTYLGEVDADTRAANLARGWELARAKGLLLEEPPPDDSWASSSNARAVMRANRGKDTGPELRLRSLLHRDGLRYRVGVRPLPEVRRTADVVFAKAKIAIFVDGCFWHGCPDHHRPSTKNADFWRAKIDNNRARDAETDQLLTAADWTVIRVWEHDDPEQAADTIIRAVRGTTRPT